MMIPPAPACRGSTVGAALSHSATHPNFAIPGRGTSLSNEVNATESTHQLIWTALMQDSQARQRVRTDSSSANARKALRVERTSSNRFRQKMTVLADHMASWQKGGA
jgi:hypothetical protein